MASYNGHGTELVERQGHESAESNDFEMLNTAGESGQESVGSEDFETLKKLGEGAFAKVSLVRKTSGHDAGALYADKVISKELVLKKEATVRHTLAEREILEAVLGYPFLVQFHYAFQTNTNLHFVMDFMNGGQLLHHLVKRHYFVESEVRIYVAEMTLALQTLHELDIVYRDLKPENVLLDSHGHIVLADFGLAKKFPPSHPTKRTNTFVGTPMYMSPEMILGAGHSFETDWFSLGALTYELLTGVSPFLFPNDSTEDTLRRILKGQVDYPKFITGKCKNFIQKLLCMDPACRLGAGGAQQVKCHPFLQSMNWKRVMEKQILTPFRPRISDPLDLSNFNQVYTNAPVKDSQSDLPAVGMDVFKDFDYTASWSMSG